VINALFFYTYYAYLQGDIEKTRMYFEMLKEEYNTHRSKTILDTYQFKELKNIRGALETGTITTNTWVNENSTPNIGDSGVGLKQNDLVRKIHLEASDSLRECLDSDGSLYLYNIEHPCGRYGRVDMVYMDSAIVYPTEIKPAEGRHDILGQIAKYTLYFRTLLHLRHFRHVQPVTICNSYDKHTLTELKRMSVMTLSYSLSEDRVIIRAV